jgi:DNA-binding helix-hairpin-helix protein with protein kinase domain
VPAPLSAGCACADCQGDRPAKLPDTPPAGGGAVLDHLAALVDADATPSALSVPAGTDTPERLPPAGRHVPTDLVVVFSRLTI